MKKLFSNLKSKILQYFLAYNNCLLSFLIKHSIQASADIFHRYIY